MYRKFTYCRYSSVLSTHRFLYIGQCFSFPVETYLVIIYKYLSVYCTSISYFEYVYQSICIFVYIGNRSQYPRAP